jgi:hypothetical protein
MLSAKILSNITQEEKNNFLLHAEAIRRNEFCLDFCECDSTSSVSITVHRTEAN